MQIKHYIPDPVRGKSFLQNVRSALGPTHLPIQCAPWFFPGGIAGRGVNHSPTSNASVKNGWSYASAPFIRLHGVGRENTTFHLYLPQK